MSKIGFIYMITSPTGRLYIGSTVNVKDRWRCYYTLNCKSQPKLYNSLLKHGSEKHTFEVIMETSLDEMWKYETLIGWGFSTLEKENLNCKLPKFGDIYKVCSDELRLKIGLRNKGTVVTQEQKDHLRKLNLGKKLSQETCIKMGKSRLGNKHALGKTRSLEFRSTMNRDRFKQILQYDLDNNFIKEWESIKSATNELNIHLGHIGQVCMNKRKTAGGFLWKYKK